MVTFLKPPKGAETLNGHRAVHFFVILANCEDVENQIFYANNAVSSKPLFINRVAINRHSLAMDS